MQSPPPPPPPSGYHRAPQPGHYPGPPPPYRQPMRTPNAAMSWALGLAVFVLFIPFVSSVLAGIAMAVAGRLDRHKGPLAAENGRRAANWGLTYALATVLLGGTHFGVLFVVKSTQDFYPLGIFLTLWGVISVVHVIVSIVGVVKANSQKLVRWNGIPFFRSP
ncbi:MAG: DUF4870 domain-containing protein [Propionibacteriaceae bacterium]|nr:DUF4870 domain-containing protein [Propionibacteriaceae bacterium]